ncbi:MAG TPA: N-acetylmuramoyl-L-alanine amidase, partial [Polyangiaceae bacterium]|nr:N-acetylmuramoyl-L-alanine amidase [Polyangiaceae bacterium]
MQSMRRVSGLLLGQTLVLAALFFGCSQRSGNPSMGERSSKDETLGARADVVATADGIAVKASREQGKVAVAGFAHAAALRERLWRFEAKTADGLEAVELLAQAGKAGSCRDTVASTALRFEIGGDLAQSTQSLQALSDSRDPACNELARKLLRLLAGEHGATTSSSASTSPGTPASTPEANAPGAHPVTARVLSVERYPARDAARIVVALSRPVAFRTGLLRAEDAGLVSRLYVDMDQAVVDQPQSFEMGGLVQRVRIAPRTDGVRLVLDLEESVERRVFYVPEPFRLIVDVARGSTILRLSSRGPRVIERVVIDPGHGGHDPGAVGPRGLREKDVTLDIAHRAGPLIARELGLSTLLTRDTDKFVSLDERTARANAFGADLFVSIHCNAAERTGRDGIMTFVLDASSDAAASRVAALENAASDAAAKELATAYGRTQDEGLLTRSLHFAELLQRATIASLTPQYGPVQNQGVRRAGFYVLAGAHMPAVLFEVSFISNPSGEVRLNTGDYRQKLADSLVNAVRAYRDGL